MQGASVRRGETIVRHGLFEIRAKAERGKPMISYEAIVAEIAKYVEQAKNIKNESALREELAAVRALCDVALHHNGGTDMQKPSIAKTMTAMSTVQAKPQQSIPQQMPNAVYANKLEESDANGDSIFDF